MAFSFDDLTPAARRAAFAHMGAKGKLGSGGRHKKLSAKGKKSLSDGHGKGTISGKLGSGSVKGTLTPADHDSGSIGGKLPIAKARPSAPKAAAKPSAPSKPSTPDTPEARFNNDFTDFMRTFTANRSSSYVGMVDVRKELDGKGMPRAEQDAHLKRMGREGKLHIVQEDNRKAMRQEDHDAALNLGGEPQDLVQLSTADAEDFAKLRKNATAKPSPAPKKSAPKSAQDSASLAKDFVKQHGADSVAPRIAFLEKKKRLLPGERAQLAALKTLGNK